MDDNFVEHIRVGGQPHGLFFHILAVEFYFTVEISEVRNLHFFGMDGILYLERKLTVGVRDRAGRTARNRNIESVCACKGVNPASDSVMSKYPHSCLCIAFISHIV